MQGYLPQLYERIPKSAVLNCEKYERFVSLSIPALHIFQCWIGFREVMCPLKRVFVEFEV